MHINVNTTQERHNKYEKKHESLKVLINEKLKDVKDYRYRVSVKETELLMIFRELCSVDLYVPDHVFEQQIVKQKEKTENYIVPMKTFWKPIHVDEWIEADLTQEKF